MRPVFVVPMQSIHKATALVRQEIPVMTIGFYRLEIMMGNQDSSSAFILIRRLLAVLTVTSTGVLPRRVRTMHGSRTSFLAASSTAIRSTSSGLDVSEV